MPDNQTWGIHMGLHVGSDPIDNGYVAIGWTDMGDIRELPRDRGDIKQKLALTYPDVKPGAIPGWAGILYRFLNELKAGDHIIYPSKTDRMINTGVVTKIHSGQ